MVASAALAVLFSARASICRADVEPLLIMPGAEDSWHSQFVVAMVACGAVAAASIWGLSRLRSPGMGGRNVRAFLLAKAAVVGAALLAAALWRVTTDPEIVGDVPGDSVTLLRVFLFPLVATLLVEIPIISAAGGFTHRSTLAGTLVNTATNPLATAAFLAFTFDAHLWYRSGSPALDMIMGKAGISTGYAAGLVLAIEAVVVVVEAALLRWSLPWSRTRAVVTAVVANLASLSLGWYVFAMLWWAMKGIVGPPLYP